MKAPSKPARAHRLFGYPLSICALLAIIAALLWPAVVDPSLLPAVGPNSDLLVSHWPNALFLQGELTRTGSMPEWNPYYGGGRPVGADPLAAAYYPPTQLLRVLSIRDFFFAIIAGHLVWAGIGVLFLARSGLRLSPSAALVAALAYALSPRLVGHLGAGHITMLQAASWLPWVALACAATIRSPAKWAAPLAGCLALLLLAGHPQLAYYGLLMVGGCSAWLLALRYRREGSAAALHSLLGLGAAVALGVLLAAVHLVPLAELTAHSTRQAGVAAADQLAPELLLSALLGARIPSPVPHEASFEPGLAILGLGLVAAVARPRSSLPLILVAATVAGIALGQSSLAYRAAAALLPSFDQFRGLARIWFLAVLAIALLAGLGVEALLQRARGRGTLRAALGLVVVGVVALNLISLSSPFLALGAIGPVTTPSALERAAASAAGAGKIYGAQRNVSHLAAVTLGTKLAHGQDPLLVEPYASFVHRASGYDARGYQLAAPSFDAPEEAQPDVHLLGLLDVTVVISRAELSDPALVPLGRVGEAHLYRNTAARGPAYLVEPGPDGAAPSLDNLRPAAGEVEQTASGIGLASYRSAAPVEAYLVLASAAFPGWRATLDGEPVDLTAIGGVLPTVRVGPGEHRLELAYESEAAWLGRALTGLGLGLAVGWQLIVVAYRPASGRDRPGGGCRG